MYTIEDIKLQVEVGEVDGEIFLVAECGSLDCVFITIDEKGKNGYIQENESITCDRGMWLPKESVQRLKEDKSAVVLSYDAGDNHVVTLPQALQAIVNSANRAE